MKQRYKSLFETFFNSLKGNDKEWFKEQKSNSIPFERWDITNKKDIRDSCSYYTFTIQEPKMQYKFTINIYKYKLLLWWFRYSAIILINENKNWGSNIEKIGISHNDGYQDELKNIYSILRQRDLLKFKEAEDEKVNRYVRDAILSVDKSVLRDEKLDQILK